MGRNELYVVKATRAAGATKAPGPATARSLTVLLAFFGLGVLSMAAASYPTAQPGDFTIPDFQFRSGETLPELKIHYQTLGTPRQNGSGLITNAVLVLHGTTGNGGNFLRPEFAGELFATGVCR